MIQIASRLKKTRLEEQMKFKIKQLEMERKTTKAHNMLLELKETRKALDKLLTYKAEGALRFSKQRCCERGNRASRLLALKLHKMPLHHIIKKTV